MSISVVYGSQVTVTEIIGNNTISAAAGKRTVTHDALNQAATLNSGTTPPVTDFAAFLLTLSSGTATINLRTLTGTNGAVVDGNGKKVQIVRVKNLGANSMTFATGASNGHNLFTTDGVIIPPGGELILRTNDNQDDIGDSHKTWDITGTLAQTADVEIVIG